MSLLGKKSVSSLLEAALKVFWYLIIVILVTTVVLLFIDLFNPGFFKENASFSLSLFGPGMNINIISELIEPPRPALFLLIICIVLSLALAIIYQLRKIFATLADNNPFTIENSKRLRIMGILVIAGSLIYHLIGYVIGLSTVKSLATLDIKDFKFQINFHPDLGMLFMGIVLLILAEIFHRGCHLQEEIDLTV